MKRACLGYRAHSCGVLIEVGARRCVPCQQQWNRQRGTTAQRGYGSRHQREGRDAIEEEGWCHWPGCMVTTDLTAQHLVAGDREAGYTVLCRRHNTIDANARRYARA